MIEQFGERYYVTGLIGSLRMSTGELTWINAGHPQPLLVRDGSADTGCGAHHRCRWGSAGPSATSAVDGHAGR